MRLKAYKKIGDNPIVEDVAVVVVELDGKPICVACDLGGGMVSTAHAGDPEFNRILHTLGFDMTVITDVLDGALAKPADLPVILG